MVSLERNQELRYSTIDPQGVIRQWSLTPSVEGMELVLVRARVENHTAVGVAINVNRTADELRDFSNATYLPLLISRTAWRDFRGEDEALVRMDLGQCFDGTRVLIDVGATVRWRSEAVEYQPVHRLRKYRGGIAVGPVGRADIAPGASLTHTFGEAGMYPYVCGNSIDGKWLAEIYAAPPSAATDYIERTTQFIQGLLELLPGHGLDGYLVFEAPIGVEFREMRWRSGDSCLTSTPLAHSRNPMDEPVDLDYFEKKIPVWLQEIVNTLDTHQVMLLHHPDHFYIVKMKGDRDGSAQCTPFTKDETGTFACAWPDCVSGASRQYCEFWGRPWRECTQPEKEPEQTQGKMLGAMADEEETYERVQELLERAGEPEAGHGSEL